MIVGLFLQQAIALFVLKTNAGFSIFKWTATLASDFLNQALTGAAFFFDQEVVSQKHWFFVNTVSLPLFLFISRPDDKNNEAFVHHLLHSLCSDDVLPGRHAVVYQELVCPTRFLQAHSTDPSPLSAWVFFKLLGVSGAEAVVASASPWIGQGESACLVRPYVDCKLATHSVPTFPSNDFPVMTESELRAFLRFTEGRKLTGYTPRSHNDLWVLYNCWISFGCLYQSWRFSGHPCNFICHEHSGVHLDQ